MRTLKQGTRRWFEYHCFESEASSDAKLWHRSHRRVTIVAIEPNDGMNIPTRKERLECGQLLAYTVRFDDGTEFTAFEDELLTSRKQFCRPDPPNKATKALRAMMPPKDKKMKTYNVFTRTWWAANPDWPNGLEPCPGKKRYLRKGVTCEEARAICREYNGTHDPGRFSRRAEFEES